jgi:nitroimidazol reductase NimA-like FMN-containing flavoprotein (pyridoxamine 5'-phosphate oxidase superfamily)
MVEEEQEPVSELSAFSSPGAVPTTWARGRAALKDAESYLLTTVRPDGRPHVTPLVGIWLNGSLHFCTGPDERKAKNLEQNPQCILTTGNDSLEGFDVVLEGRAERVGDEAERREIADTFEAKYGPHFAEGGTWSGLGDAMRSGEILLYRVVPAKIFGFEKGERQYSQTRWRFGS